MSRTPGSDLLDHLASVSVFRALPPDHLARLAGRVVRRRFGRGETILRQGERGATLYVIVSGTVKVSGVSPGGREAVVALLGPGEVFGELSMLHPRVRSTGAHALEECEVLALRHDDVRPCLERHPGAALALLDTLAGRFRRLEEAFQALAFNDVPARVARCLLDLVGDRGLPVPGGLLIDLPLTQEDLAAMVGAARETVNKVLGGFAARGWLRLEDRRYVVTDLDALRRRATG